MAGETTSAVSADVPFEMPAGVFLVPFTVAYSTTQNETNDVMELGYLPSGVIVYGLIYAPTDMDSGTALVQKVTIGSTDVATGLTGGQTGAKTFVPIVPQTLTAKTLAKVTSTTAAGTAVAGSLYIAFLCQK